MTVQRPPERSHEDPETASSREISDRRPVAPQGEHWPLIDVFREGNKVVVAADLPGVAADAITVRVSAQEIRVLGERTIPLEPEGRAYHEKERHFGRFERVIHLPKPILPQTVSAHVEGGVLTFEAEIAGS